MDQTTRPDNVKTKTMFVVVSKYAGNEVRQVDTYASGREHSKAVVSDSIGLTWKAAKQIAKAVTDAYAQGKLDSGDANGDAILPKGAK